MNSDNLISIILPTYNRSSLLSRAIQSVIEQTYPNWELIIWDDGSTDDTASVVFSFNNDRIKYFHDKNMGMSYALNKAIEHASGNYIAFLDDDDYWLSGKLHSQLEFLTQNPEIDLLFGNFRNINIENNTEGDGFKQNKAAFNILRTRRIYESFYSIEENFLESITHSNYIAFDSVLLNKTLINNIGPFNESLRNGMDFNYWWRIGLSEGKLAFTTDVVLIREKYPNSLSSPSTVTFENQLKTLDACREQALAAGKPAHSTSLHNLYRNAWQNLVTAYSEERQGGKMLNAFFQSLKYGFRPGSVRLLLQGGWRLFTKGKSRN